MSWLLLFVSLLLITIAGVFYLVTRFHRFGIIQKLSEKHKFLSWIVSILPIGGIMCFTLINIYSAIVVLLHLIIFWLVADIIASIIRKAAKKQRKRNIEGAFAIIFTAVYLSFGWYSAHHVSQVDYSLITDKNVSHETIRIAAIADSHLGITLDGEAFAEQTERIQQTEPDIVFVAGDFVDDDSNKADMIEACAALGRLDTTYGVYFTFGNHDKGYYQGHRDFNIDDLRAELEKNGVVILEDESVLIDDSFYVIGRQDKSVTERANMEELTKDLDKSKLMLVLDHQPNDYENEAASGVDLVFSGHTHGGHIWPAGYVGLLIKANDRVYGAEKRENTDFIVTSGISGWAIPFKTGTSSEFVVIDIEKK